MCTRPPRHIIRKRERQGKIAAGELENLDGQRIGRRPAARSHLVCGPFPKRTIVEDLQLGINLRALRCRDGGYLSACRPEHRPPAKIGPPARPGLGRWHPSRRQQTARPPGKPVRLLAQRPRVGPQPLQLDRRQLTSCRKSVKPTAHGPHPCPVDQCAQPGHASSRPRPDQRRMPEEPASCQRTGADRPAPAPTV